MSRVQPGWFPDPSSGGQLRWWDGARWTEHTAPPGAPMPPAARTSAANTDPRRRMPVWGWVLIGLAALAAIRLIAPLLVIAGLVVLVTAVIGLSTGTRTWLRIPSRKAAIATVAGSFAALLIAGVVSASMLPRVTSTETTTEPQRFVASAPTDSASATPTPTRTPTTQTRSETVTQAIPFERTTVEDPAVDRGQNWVTTEGRDGVRELSYRVTIVDGVETARELISDIVTAPAVSEVTTVGTYDPPPPPPEPEAAASECDPNYADACVPIASDVDCAWGSGNGPAYFDGVARVIGRDIYGLDRDGDGWACER